MRLNKSIMEFIKYGIVGTTNVIIDFSILNLLMYITSVYKGRLLIIFNIISFIVYSSNGYLLNRKFTFKSVNSSYFLYIVVLGSAMIINSYILYFISINNIMNINKVIWANSAKLFASVISGIFSFLLNKNFVFKKNAEEK
ncbi:MAG: GtrA family protein [Bacillota bacterium]|nr:GtrA family protein [Bacillota bacterium]